MNKKILLIAAATTLASTSTFAANRINLVSSNPNTGRTLFASLPTRSASSSALPSLGSGSSTDSLAALPTLNENLKLRGPGFGKTAYVVPIPVIKIPKVLTLAVTAQNGGSGHFSTLGVDLGVLTQSN